MVAELFSGDGVDRNRGRNEGVQLRSPSFRKSLWAGGLWGLRSLRQPGFRSRNRGRSPQHTEGSFRRSRFGTLKRVQARDALGIGCGAEGRNSNGSANFF